MHLATVHALQDYQVDQLMSSGSNSTDDSSYKTTVRATELWPHTQLAVHAF
jgi:hypothetical protein